MIVIRMTRNNRKRLVTTGRPTTSNNTCNSKTVSSRPTSSTERDSAVVTSGSEAVIVKSPVHWTVKRRHRRNLISELRVNLAMVITALAMFYLISHYVGTISNKEAVDDNFRDSHENVTNSPPLP